MREYTIVKKPEPFDWSAVPRFSIDHLLWSDPVSIAAEGAMCYDDSGLYVLLQAQEDNIRAENTGKLDAPCEDSCLEFFFSPIPGDNRYFNIELNPNGCLFLGFGSNRYNLLRLIPRNEPFSVQASMIPGGWMVTYKILWSFVQQFFPEFDARPGIMMRGNFYKCGDLTVQPHYFSWNPITLTNPEFHCPDHFGLLRFE